MARRARGAPLLLLLAACAGPAPCPPGTEPATRAELLLGRNRDGVPAVPDAAWAAFLDAEVTPRFPDGFTVLDAAGQWRDRHGVVEREASRVLLVLLPGTGMAAAATRLEPVAEAYRRRFGQDAVGRTVQASCAGF